VGENQTAEPECDAGRCHTHTRTALMAMAIGENDCRVKKPDFRESGAIL
jgi:hypothetical protein